ncbi:hypothetical protein D3C87_1345030 [compost metagenome]
MIAQHRGDSGGGISVQLSRAREPLEQVQEGLDRNALVPITADDDVLLGRQQGGDPGHDRDVALGDEKSALQRQPDFDDQHLVVDIKDAAVDVQVAVASPREAEVEPVRIEGVLKI